MFAKILLNDSLKNVPLAVPRLQIKVHFLFPRTRTLASCPSVIRHNRQSICNQHCYNNRNISPSFHFLFEYKNWLNKKSTILNKKYHQVLIQNSDSVTIDQHEHDFPSFWLFQTPSVDLWPFHFKANHVFRTVYKREHAKIALYGQMIDHESIFWRILLWFWLILVRKFVY